MEGGSNEPPFVISWCEVPRRRSAMPMTRQQLFAEAIALNAQDARGPG